MQSREQIIARVEGLIEKLGQPISSAEAADGWTEEPRRDWIKFFVDLRNRLRDGKPLTRKEKSSFVHIGRWMDHDGIIGGELLDEACRISNDLGQSF